MLLPSIKMQKPFQLVHRTYLMSHRTCIFPFLKGQRCLLNTKHKMVSLALTSQHQCLHTSAAVCVSKERASSQPVDHRNKELEGENLTTLSGNLAQRDSIEPNSVELDPLQDKPISLVQRFKRTFKQYGKILIPVHLLTSSIWFGAFYYAALK
ncbi:protein FAM210A-like [Rhineura floridana]|uniref:protein FAM210A-like n=1 Tax=Rhineura floridana TaxID=261503 RepID=UPI002AC866C6|nr:protein FAM210A-like [Rhineura floridana]